MRFKLLVVVITLLFSFSAQSQNWEKLNNQVLSYLGKGDYPNALSTALEAREVAKVEFGENHMDYSASLHNLASAHKKLGEFTPAEALYWEALKIDKSVLGVKHQNYALSLFGLANLYKLKKEQEKAEGIYLDALDIMEKAVTNRHPDYALILGDYADLQTQLGNFRKAEQSLRRARNTTKYSVGDDHQDYASILFYYGKLFKTKGSIGKAENSLNNALKLFEKTVGKNHPDYKDCLRYLNNLYDPEFELYKAAPTELVFKKEGLANGASKKYVRPDAKDFEALTSEDLEISVEKVEIPNTRESDKGGNYNPTSGSKMDAPKVNEKPVVKNDLPKTPTTPSPNTSNPSSWNDYSMMMDKHTQRGRYTEAIDAGEKAVQLVKAEFGEDHENYTWISLKLADSYEKAGMKEKAIPFYEKDLMQIEKNGQEQKVRDYYKKGIYSSIEKFNFSSLSEQSRMLSDMQKESAEYYYQSIDLGYLVGGNEMQNINLSLKGRDTDAALGIKFSMNGELDSYQEQLKDKLKSNEVAIDFMMLSNPKNQKESYYALVSQRGSEETKMIPLGEESKINKVLQDAPNSTSSYIQNSERNQLLYKLIWEPIEEHLRGVNFVHVSTIGALNKLSFGAIQDTRGKYLADQYEIYYYSSLRDFINDKRMDSRNETVSFFGGVDYGGGSAGKINYMPATKDEVNTFKVVCSAKGWNVDTKISSEASEETFKALSGIAPGVLHLATPIYFKEREEYSGIALSNANEKINSKQFSDNANDGLLNAIEISKLDLSQTNMVLLSATETGNTTNSETGILSIQRALKTSGVGTILFSQWKVPDKQTQEFFTLFYFNHLSGMDTRRAFFSAQKDIRKLYKSPYYWAGFILIE